MCFNYDKSYNHEIVNRHIKEHCIILQFYFILLHKEIMDNHDNY